ncbi:hypothetical protein COCMIDRAFT_33296 [Bipolaris oryzae ATCC 44560]|uniref:Uncharacterized protein n=1 Tax=Bipolaris oryzae ATCC 44560 TaxID=930090 RepID=W6ZH59_COCMI|nr:uncharacterized protein COCMIDRAFT_33296 [Bipolaris oryzae ATCC 44560]EUC49238.1 hypothetical protein COCMIDRAFT_33296 [Bipolaris oryzae ATCC 44560]
MSYFLSILEEARGETSNSHKATPASITPRINIVRLTKGVPRTQANMGPKDSCDTDFGHSRKSRLPPANKKKKMSMKRRKTPSSNKTSCGKTSKNQKPSSTTSASRIIRAKNKMVTVSRAKQNLDHDSEEQDVEDDFVVEDMAYNPQKSKVGAMARSKLFTGMK